MLDKVSAAFSLKYFKTRDFDQSAQYANAVSAVSLRFRSNQLKYIDSDIKRILNRKINKSL